MQEVLLIQPSTLAAGPLVLVSWWKPLVLLVPFLGWAWLITTIYSPHAERFHLGRDKWNLIHLIAGTAGFIVAVAMPVPGIAGLLAGIGAMLLILLIDAIMYPVIANKDERVPDEHKLSFDFSAMKEAREAKAAAKQAGTSELKIVRGDKTALPVPDSDAPEYPIRVSAEQVLIQALARRASQVDIIPTGPNTYAASYLVDGVRQQGEPVPAREAVAAIDLWKVAAGLSVDERRKKQTGTCDADYAGTTTKTKVITSGGRDGQRATLLFNPEQAVRRKPEELGLFERQFEALQGLVDRPGGVVLVAAPADQGGTTTLYSILKMHDAYTSNVQTIEADIQSSLEGVRQNPFDATEEDADYAKFVRSTLRRDPDVVALGELPDAETAKVIAEADLERSTVYVPVRADSAMSAIQMWARAIGDTKAASKSLKGVVSQKLLRKLCENCRVPYTPAPDMLKKLGLAPDKVQQLYKKGGQVLIKNKPETCPVCEGVGYVGQTGVFEVYPIGDAEQKLLAAGNLAALKTEFRKSGLPSLQQAAIRKAVEGVTSVEEVMRVTAPPQKPQAKPAAKPAPAKS